MRINRYIASCGIESRREAEALILDGRIKLNGKVVTNLSTKVLDNDRVHLDNKLLTLQTEKVYILMNKPRGYLTTCEDDRERKTIMDLLPPNLRALRVFPIGRLDYDTTGLLILTNDGMYANALAHPSNNVPKVYLVQSLAMIHDAQIEELGKSADNVRRYDQNAIQITIHQGRNRIVRKMCANVGIEVAALERIAIGKLSLPHNLERGKIIVQNTPPKV